MRASSVLFGLALTVLVSVDARAHCGYAFSFGSYGWEPSTYSYVHFGADARQTTDAIVGRFWQAGLRGAGNEGFWDVSQWLETDQGFDKWEFQGYLSTYGVWGCPGGELVLVLQDTTLDDSDAVFVAGRVLAHPALVHTFPFWLTGLEWNAVKFPTACRQHQQRHMSTVTLDLALDDIAGGFYGEPGMLKQDTISGYTVWVAHGTADPGRSPAAWTLAATVPYTGVPGVLSGLQVDCSVFDDVYVAVGLEFDHGQITSDFVGKPTRILCNRMTVDPSDPDADGSESRCDNCPYVSNADQRDTDHDGLGDACDDCPLDPNPQIIDPSGAKNIYQRPQRCRDIGAARRLF